MVIKGLILAQFIQDYWTWISILVILLAILGFATDCVVKLEYFTVEEIMIKWSIRGGLLAVCLAGMYFLSSWILKSEFTTPDHWATTTTLATDMTSYFYLILLICLIFYYYKK